MITRTSGCVISLRVLLILSRGSFLTENDTMIRVHNRDSVEQSIMLPVLIAAVLSAGCSDTATPATDSDDTTSISRPEAQRLHRLLDDSPPTPPLQKFQTATRGIVVDVSDRSITIESASVESTLPLADDVVYLRTGAPVPSSEVNAGDEVRLVTEQWGSHSDGWIRTVVRIDVGTIAQPKTDVVPEN